MAVPESVRRLMAMCATLTLAACGGGDVPEPKTAVSRERAASPGDAPVWSFCANEHEVCGFSGTIQVRYGANGSYAFGTHTGGVACSNDVFGDPAPDFLKRCDIAAPSSAPTSAPAEAQWSFCANEHAACSFSGTAQVRYGANGTYAFATRTGGVACSNEVFGDPVPGVLKHCDLASASPAPSPAPPPAPAPAAAPAPPAPQWTFCANEHGVCSFSGTAQVRYGANGTFVSATHSGGVVCNNTVFGDPVPGVLKRCDIASAAPAPPPPPTAWSFCADEHDVCEFSGTLQVRYGANGTFVVGTYTGGVLCNNEVFGDPLSGVLKHCETSSPASGNAPVVTINAPTASTFKAGDTLSFSGSATDTQDGALGASALLWWADLHHDAHIHPAVQPTPGGSGTLAIPARGHTEENIWYRFHLRATDNDGMTTEVTRDVLPQKSQVALATQPAGLTLTLDGQPVTAPLSFTGVVGTERDLGAPKQSRAGREYQFSGWNDGGAATHTIVTPAANTVYTATFVDIGPATNQPPSVSLGAAATGKVGTPMPLTATVSDGDGTIAKVEFRDGTTKIGEDTQTPFGVSWTPATTGVHNLTALATDDDNATATSAIVQVTITASGASDTQGPSATLTAPGNYASGLNGTVNLAATATDNVGVASVEFQVDGVTVGTPDGSAPYGVSVDSSAYASGQHIVRARAFDAAGNASPWASATVRFGGNRSLPAGFSKNEGWISGLSNATAFAQVPDGRMLVALQGGQVRVVKNGTLLGTAFVQLNVESSGERGVIGVAAHPNFGSNGYVYIHYTTNAGGTHNRISRFTASGDVASAGSEVVLVDLPPLSGATNHNGGALHFGVDGKLYVGVGDNANGAKAQDLSNPFGKILRFNDDGSIPSDNPFFASQSGLARSVWAYGLRNPFTFAVQPGSGRIHINDVGEVTWEEINVGAPGANYGWPASEGPDNLGGGVSAPMFNYKHSDASPPGSGPGGFITGFAIAGGAFYPASGSFPSAYRNSYYFADYVSRFIARVDLANGNAAYAFASISGEPVDVLVGLDGALYVLTRSGIARISAP